ncbi:MAG: GNAT family N-acetyltransferase, partial [Sinomicrobium sp.]|nr:GNAT family N-acetyltransferase [Sinomicrobium sp.]
MESEIRKAVWADLDQLTELFDAYRVFYEKSPDKNAVKAFLTERIANGDSELFVAADPNGDIAGFVQLYPLFSSTQMKRFWLL